MFTFTEQMPTTHSGTTHLLERNSYFFFPFYLADVYLLHIQISEKNIHVIITLNSNEDEYNLMSIRITHAFIFSLLSYLFFHLEQLKNLKNQSRGGLFTVIKHSINFVDN